MTAEKSKSASSADKEDKKPELDDKALATVAAIEQIKERFGEGSIMKLGEARRTNIDAIPTGCLSLDIALGIGGVPRGRIIEIFGPEMSGKSTLAQHIVAEVQKKGGIAAYVDAEHALDPDYAKKLGVKVDDLLVSQPDTGEQALEIVETLVRSNGVDIIVIDSVAALVPKKEIEGEMGDQHMALQARLMSQALRKLAGVVGKTNTVVVFINQIRMKIGVFFGNPETTPGGTALKFYSSVRIEVRRAAQIKMGEKIIGNRVRCKVVKNKVAAPFRTCLFDIMYNEGISLTGDLIDLGVEHSVIAKNGNTYIFEGEKIGLGREASKRGLKENSKMMKEIGKRIWSEVRAKEREDG